jgi:hypothetical protein
LVIAFACGDAKFLNEFHERAFSAGQRPLHGHHAAGISPQAMARRNQGPRLRWLDKCKRFYVTWTERGRSRECSTGTVDREQAEIFFARFMRCKDRRLPTASEDVRGVSAAEWTC